MKILIGIDPGAKTGIAISIDGQLETVRSMKAVEAESLVLSTIEGLTKKHGSIIYCVYWEDARLRTWFGKKGAESKQGAGSIKCDSRRWEEFLEYHKIRHIPVAPKNNITKLNDTQFRRLTGWKHKSNEHGRDAAGLIWGRK